MTGSDMPGTHGTAQKTGLVAPAKVARLRACLESRLEEPPLPASPQQAIPAVRDP